MNCFFLICLLYFTHPFVIVCFEVFHCEIHDTVPLLQINILPFCRSGPVLALARWGQWGATIPAGGTICS